MPVHQERTGAVCVVTIDRPEVRNALDQAALHAITAALDAAAAPGSGVRAVVLTGSGERSFCAGLDIAAAGGGLPDPDSSPLARLRAGYPLPVIAALNGTAVGGGLELALACDLRIAASHAEFGLPEVSLGFAATEGGVELGRLIPLGVALELMLTADRMDARRAYEVGLVNHVVPPARVRDTALSLASRIAEHSPAGVRASKELAYRALWDAPSAMHALSHTRTEELMAGPDAREGMAAFLAKRRPVFRDL
jgi:enoyl-CoA hydratase